MPARDVKAAGIVETLTLLNGWRTALVGQAVIVVRAQNIGAIGHFVSEFTKIHTNPAELVGDNPLCIRPVNEDPDAFVHHSYSKNWGGQTAALECNNLRCAIADGREDLS